MLDFVRALVLTGVSVALPLAGFEKNLGQCAGEVRYLNRSPSGTLFLTDRAAILSLASGEVIRLAWMGARAHPRVEGAEPLAATTNDFRGRDAAQWRTGIPNFGAVRYRSLYPGIDLVFRADSNSFEYDFLLAPRADPSRIRLRIAGLNSGVQRVSHGQPRVMQDGKTVPGRFVLRNGVLRFALGNYDRNRPLVIDPVVSYNIRLGPRLYDVPPTVFGDLTPGAAGIAVDKSGNAYIVGSTFTGDFPVTTGAVQTRFLSGRSRNVFVSKIGADGRTLLFSTFLGGQLDDVGHGIALDPQGNVYVTGNTSSPDFPVTAGSFQSARQGRDGATTGFAAKLDPSGSKLIYSTYLGGTIFDNAAAIAADSQGNAYVTGVSASNDFPTTPGAYLERRPQNNGSTFAFVSKLNASGAGLLYSTLIGPATLSTYGLPSVAGAAIAVESNGNVYVAGTSIPSIAGYIARLSSDGSTLLASTTLGAAAMVAAIALDSAGNVYATGGAGPDFPVTSGAFQNARVPSLPVAAGLGIYPLYGFITKLNPDLSAVVYSSLMGGTGHVVFSGIQVDSGGHAYALGSTDGPLLPMPLDAIQPCLLSDSDYANAVLIKLETDASAVLYATYLGGNVRDDGLALALDAQGNAYIAGRSNSMTFESTTGAIGMTGGQVFVTKVDMSRPTSAGISCIADAASQRGGAISGGELVSIYGPAIGPAASALYQPDSAGRVSTQLSGARVLFDGVPAPVTAVSLNRIDAVVPFAASARTTTSVQVELAGKLTPARVVAVRQPAPALFTRDGSGVGQVAAINEDGTVNGPENPAPPGSSLALFGTGNVAFLPSRIDGEISQTGLGFGPVGSFQIGISNVTAFYVGTAPGAVNAVFQVNVRLPTNLSGPAVPLRYFGQGGVTQVGVTVAIQ